MKKYKKYNNKKNTWVSAISTKRKSEQNIKRAKTAKPQKIEEKTLAPAISHRIFR